MTEATRRYRLGVLEGDGIGPEIVPAAVRVVDAATAAVAGRPTVDWVPLPLGAAAIDEHGTAVPDKTLRTLAGLDGWLLGPHDSASYPEPPLGPQPQRHHPQALRPVRQHPSGQELPGCQAVSSDTDLVIVRENTQGFYADRSTYAGTGEFMPSPDVAVALGIVTRRPSSGSPRSPTWPSAAAGTAIVHKANVLKLTTGLFRDVCREIAAGYPDVTVDDFHIDADRAPGAALADFDVLVTENMMGDILSDLAGEIAGSLGIAPSINASDDLAMAQAAHGSAPDIAGRDLANRHGQFQRDAAGVAGRSPRRRPPRKPRPWSSRP